MQNKFLVEDLTLGSDFDKKFTRVLATNEHKAGNYWKRETSYTGKCFESLKFKKSKMTFHSLYKDHPLVLCPVHLIFQVV